MTHDPERWLISNQEGEFPERALLRSIRDVSPPAGAKDAAWQAIAAQVGVAGTVVGTAAGGAALQSASGAKTHASLATSAVFKVTVAKLAALGIAITGLGGVWLWTTPPAAIRQLGTGERIPVALKERVSEAVAPSAQPSLLIQTTPQPPVDLSLERKGGPEAPARIAKPTRREMVDEAITRESARLTEARAALREGKPALAKSVLKRLAEEVPKPALGQEREVLMIEILAAEGQQAAVEQRVRAFMSRYPSSPHSAHLARFLKAK